ncbi:MAG: PAS domain S-box protein, partial [Bacteroidales bacterium]|nr:PAS domain S-box protein [Bacteroidales bacterium]
VTEVFPESKKEILTAFRKVFTNGQTLKFTFHGKTLSGEEVWRENNIFLLDSESVVSVYTDVTELKKNEIELASSEARYKALADAATEAVFIMENGKCIDINEKASEVYGYSREEAIGIPILDLIAPKSKELVREKFSLDYAELYEGWCIRKNGEIFPAQLRGKNFDYVGRKVRISTIRDISIQKYAEIQLTKSEAKFRAYFEEHTAIKLQIDVETTKITNANKAAVQFYGYALEELKSLSILDLNALPRKEVFALMQLAKTGEKNSFSFPHRLKTGELRNMETYTSIIKVDGRKYFFSILHDVTDSKKTEEELKRSEARFRAYFENNTAAMFQVDPLTQEIVAANKAALDFYGYSFEEFKNLKVYDINVLNKEEINQKMESVMNSSAQNFIFQHRLSSGEIREVEVYASPIKTLSESQLFITIYDVTEREKNKYDLEQNERKLNEAQRIAKIGNWEYSYEKQKMTWSKEIYKILEIDSDYQIDPANYNRLIHTEDLEKVNQDFSEAMKNKRPYFNVHRIITPNGHIKYIEENGYGIYNENGEIIQAVGTAQDITIQKTAENKLLQNEKYLQEAQRIAKVGNFELDLQTKDVNWSEEVDRIFGYDAASGEKQYQFYRSLIHPDDVENVDREFQKAKKDNRGYSLVYRIISTFGEIKYIEEKGYFEYEKDKNKTIVIGTLQDITINHFIKKDLEDSKAKLAEINKGLEIKVQEELKKSREKDHLLIQQSRHAVLGEMIGNIAHQWRQPLNEVSLLINDLEDAYSFGVLNKEYFDKTIEIVYRRLKFMSDTINDFSKMHTDDFKAENFKPNLLIEKLIQFIEENFKKYKIKIKFMYDAEFEVYGYPNMLSHVILNLLNNSKDILTEREVKAPKIWIKLEQNTENYIIRILDNGQGVSSAYIDKIFDPYFTTKDKKRGSGLGLYMAKSMIEEHMKGRIEVQNQREGAEFTITLNTNEDR